MSRSTIGQFDFQLFKRPKDASLPMHPFVRLCLQHWGDTIDPSGAPAISSNLMTEQEIELHVRDLKNDLDRVLLEAKNSLAKATLAHRADPTKN